MQIVNQFKHDLQDLVVKELLKISVEITKDDLEVNTVYGILDKPRINGVRNTNAFVQGILSCIHPIYEFSPFNDPKKCLGEFVFFDTYLNNDEFRGVPTGYYKIDSLILMEGGY